MLHLPIARADFRKITCEAVPGVGVTAAVSSNCPGVGWLCTVWEPDAMAADSPAFEESWNGTGALPVLRGARLVEALHANA